MKHDVGDWDRNVRRRAAAPHRRTVLRQSAPLPVRAEGEVPWPGLRAARLLAQQVEREPLLVRPDDLLAGDWQPRHELPETPWQARAAIDWPGLLGLGLDGFARLLDRRREEIRLLDPARPEKLAWHDAAETALAAARRWVERHQELAARQLEAGPDGELPRLAQQTAAIVGRPPVDLAEALQLIWSVMLCLAMESDGDASLPSLGHLDTLLAPYLAKENAPQPLLIEFLRRLRALDPGAEILLGPAPEPAALAILAAAQACGGAAPAVTLGWEDASAPLLPAAIAAAEAGCSVRVIEDQSLTDELHRFQIASSHAHDHVVHEGGEPSVAGRSAVWLAGPAVGLDPLLADAVRNLTEPATRDELLEAVGQRMEAAAHAMIARGIERQAMAERRLAWPLRSLLTQGCLESGRDVCRGGSLYSFLLLRAAGLDRAAAWLEGLQQAMGEEPADAAALLAEMSPEASPSDGWRAMLRALWSEAVEGCRDRFGGHVLVGYEPRPTVLLTDAADPAAALADALADGAVAVRLPGPRQDIGGRGTTDRSRSTTGD